ncbi:MAG: CpsD/CapB family tyrosine-protein kinase [Pseudomonadota bacterium]
MEYVGSFYALRLGLRPTVAELRPILEKVRQEFPGAVIIPAVLDGSRLVPLEGSAAASPPPAAAESSLLPTSVAAAQAPAPEAASFSPSAPPEKSLKQEPVVVAAAPAASSTTAPEQPRTAVPEQGLAPTASTTDSTRAASLPQAPSGPADSGPAPSASGSGEGDRKKTAAASSPASNNAEPAVEWFSEHLSTVLAGFFVVFVLGLFVLRRKSQVKKKIFLLNKDALRSMVEYDPPALSEEEETTVRKNIGELAAVQSNLLSQGKDIRTIYVSSCYNGEGKTRAAVQLAHALSINRSKVVLLDANPRAPRLHAIYHVAPTPGLCDHLAGKNFQTNRLIRKTKYNNLYLITFGERPEGRPDFFTSGLFTQLLEQLKQHFDYVIVDGHSFIGASDTPMIASKLDGMVLVVECEKTKWEVVQMASEKTAMLGGRLVGLILNKRKYYVPRFIYNKL